MLALRYAGVLALTLWVGGLLVLGAIAAPSIFDVLAIRHVADDRVLAGAIFGETLRRFHLLSYACGFVLLVTLLARGILGPRPIWFAARLGTACLMVAATAYSGLVVPLKSHGRRHKSAGHPRASRKPIRGAWPSAGCTPHRPACRWCRSSGDCSCCFAN